MSNIENNKIVSIFPNPTTGIIHINTYSQDFVNIKIYNSTGHLLQEHFTAEFSIANLSSGIYFIATQTDKSTFMNQLVKQ